MACARRDVGMTSSARRASAPPLKNFEYESEGADVAIKMPNLSQTTGLFPSEKVPFIRYRAHAREDSGNVLEKHPKPYQTANPRGGILTNEPKR